jgi:hypothetical protein
MRKHRIIDADVASLLSGHTPQGRPELEALALSLSDFRAASFESVSRPSAALAARLDVGKSSMFSVSGESAFDVDQVETTSPTTRGHRSQRGLLRTVFTWIAGLGLGLKIALGATVAAAAVTGAGAAGVLPFGAQDSFDEVVSVVLSTESTDDETDDETDGDEVTDDPEDGVVSEHYDPALGNFGSWVSEQAQNKTEGENFGKKISDEAHNKPHPAETEESEVEEGDSDEADDDESDDDESSQEVGSQSDHKRGNGK